MAEAKDPREGKFELVPVRLTHPHLHVAHTPKQTKQNPTPRTQFQTGCIIDSKLLTDETGRKLLGALLMEIKRVANEAFKDKAAGFMTKVLHSKQSPAGDIVSDSGIRSPFGDGAAKDHGPGTLTFNLRSDYPFALLDAKRNKVPVKETTVNGLIKAENPALFYPGCYVSVWVRVGSYNNEGMGISLYPQAMKFDSDGERLDNRVDPNDLYGGPLDAGEKTNLDALIGAAG